MNIRSLSGFILSAALTILTSCTQSRIYVSPGGQDAGDGSRRHPVASFERAQQLAHEAGTNSQVEVIFAPGTYYLKETIRITPEDNPKSITYRSEKEGEAVISGGLKLDLSWKPWRDGIYQAEVPAGIDIDQLYIDGIRQPMARFPNIVPGATILGTWGVKPKGEGESFYAIPDLPADSTMDPLWPSRIARWNDPAGGFIHAMHAYLWGDMHYRITGKNPDGTLAMEGGWQNNRPAPMHRLYRYVENIFEELDAPGEWYFDPKTSILYYMPQKGSDPNRSVAEVVRLKRLIDLEGTTGDPVRNIRMEGFVFRHAARTFMETSEPLLRSDWTISRNGAVFCQGTEDCSLTGCEFDQVGGNAVFVSNYNRRLLVSGCYIHEAGAGGVAFVGDPATVRSPIFRYGDQDYEKMDRTPGPKGDNYPDDCRVEDCLITLTGRVEKQTAGVQISMSHGICVSHCSIYDMPRAGINISEGTFGGHIIEYCDVFNTVLETGDHGSFNSWGRDRYWTPDIKTTADEVARDTALPKLDMLGPNIIRYSRWRCDHGWDIDLDDGSSWYRIYGNLLLNHGLKLREGYDRVATDNIIINNSLHPHVWYHNSGDVFMHNIVFHSYYPIGMDVSMSKDGHWGRKIDDNFFAAPASEMRKFAVNGCDLHSMNGDPEFIDPAKGDFRVKKGSPALQVGFVNFPMGPYGVTKPSLRAIAKMPEIPGILIRKDKVESGAPKTGSSYTWMGATVTEPKGESLSAYGIGFGEGGVALSGITENSDAWKAGFHDGDLIQSIDGKPIKTIKDLSRYGSDRGKGQGKKEVVVVRKQKRVVIGLK